LISALARVSTLCFVIIIFVIRYGKFKAQKQ
jgi:hypothetical protein